MSTTFEIWPAERPEIMFMVPATVPEARSDNSARLVIELLAAVDGQSVADYLATTAPDLETVRELARFSHEALLAAAMVAPDLRPVSLLSVVSTQHALELVAS